MMKIGPLELIIHKNMDLLNILISAVAVFVSGYVMSGVHVENFIAAFVAAVFLGVVNTFIKPFIILFTLPINILTLGLFTFVINGLLVMLVAAFVPGFKVDSFWWAVLFSIIMSIVNLFLHKEML